MKRSPLKRKTRLAPVNRKRKAAAFARNFGPKAAWIRENLCAVRVAGWLECPGATAIQAAHVRSRAAGGTAADLVPLCAYHHGRQHELGVHTFGALYDLDLTALAASYERKWQARND